jgi:hypothetical protein
VPYGRGTVEQFVARREGELTAQISAIRRQLTMDALAPAPFVRTAGLSALAYGGKTIKELTLQALFDHFPNGGTVAAIRNFMRDAYDRTIDPARVRAQMHRLKADSILVHHPLTDTWNFRDGKRALFGRYSDPTSN